MAYTEMKANIANFANIANIVAGEVRTENLSIVLSSVSFALF